MAQIKLSENAKAVFQHIQNNEGQINVEVAEALGLKRTQVDPIVTALAKKGLVERVEEEVLFVTEDGTKKHKTVKKFMLTDLGANFDADAVEEPAEEV